MLSTIYLHGELGHLFGRKWKLDVSSPAEALRAIEANKPGLIAYLAQAGDSGVDFRVRVNGDTIDEERLRFNRAGSIIKITPVVRGQKDKMFSAILGVALIAFTWGAGVGLLGPALKGAMGASFLGIEGMKVGAFIGGLGVSMAAGGIAQMLASTPRTETDPSQPSYLFNGPVSNTARGGPVPLCYGGPLLIGPTPISGGIYSEDIGASGAAVSEGGFQSDSDSLNDLDPVTVDEPATQARSLRTLQKARILDLLCEGEIELCDAEGNVVDYENRNKAVLFDLTPAQNSDGSFNFTGFSTAFRPGTADQTAMAGFPASESETAVDAEVINGGDKWANAVVREIPDGDHKAVRVTIRIPALYELDGKGNRKGTFCHFSIQIKRVADATWHEVVGSNQLPNGEVDGLISGKTIEPYVRSYRIALPGEGPWQVRIGRQTEDSEDPAILANQLFWQSYTLIVDKKFTYRHSAVFGTEFDAEKFPRVPQRAFRVRGMKVKVPSNYNPVTRNYTGTWDGTFAAEKQFTNNPAWIYYDLVTSNRYGLGNYIPVTDNDKWALYEISRYCDGVNGSGNYVGVDTGRGDGSREPRFAVNVFIQSAVDAYRLIADLAAAFRGMVYFGSGLITAVQDAPKAPKFVFTNANVINGDFTYSGTDRQARHTMAYVQWNNPDNFFKTQIKEVPDAQGIQDFGVRPTSVATFGCTSEGQAWRTGYWILLTERYEKETVTFRTEMVGARVRPGDILLIRDRYETANRMGGRIASVGSGTLTLDAPVVISGAGYTLTIANADGTLTELPVTTGAGTHTTLEVTGSLTGINPGSVWVLASDAVEPASFRALNVQELESNQYQITALQYAPGKFEAVDDGTAIELPPTTDLPPRTIPTPPSELDVEESAVATADGRDRFLELTWKASATRFVRGYKVEYRAPGAEWTVLDEFTTRFRSSRLPVTVLGDYAFRVYAVGYYSNSDPAPFVYTLAEVSAPAAVENFVVTPIANGFDLKWTDSLGDLGYYAIKINTTNTEPDNATFRASGGASQKTLSNIGSEVTRYLWIIPVLHRIGLQGPSVASGAKITLKSVAAVDAVIASVSSTVDSLVTQANNLATDLLAEVAAREAAIISEASTRNTADGVITTALNAVTADYNSNKAIVAGQISAITTTNSAQATDITALYASVGTNAANISSVSSALATLDAATASAISSLNATVGGLSSTVTTISAAYLNGGVATAVWGFKLDGGGKVVAMQAIAASGGSAPETGVIVFSGADLRSENYSSGSAGWIIRADGSVEFADGTFRGDLRLNSSTSTPGYSGNTETGFAVEAGNGAMFASRNDNFAGSFNRNDNGDLVLFHRSGNQVGTVAVTSVSTSYNTSSDERIKFNMVAAPDVGDLIDAGEVYEFEFFMQPGVKYLGFKAQQLNEVFGQAVTPGDNNNHPFLGGRPWAVDHSKLVPILWKEAQHTRSRLSDIEERLDALEAA